jgi:hypothetical protein
MLAADPILRKVFLSPRVMAPKAGTFWHRGALVTYRAELNCQRAYLDQLQVAFHRASTFQQIDRLRLGIRAVWLWMRYCSEGYYLQLPDDGCEHVVMFSDGDPDEIFAADGRALASLRHRYAKTAAAERRRHRRRGPPVSGGTPAKP